jgi:hypothetical protein
MSILVLKGNFRQYDATDRGVARHACSQQNLTRLDNCIQHHCMALSILNPSLPALEDLITLTPRRPIPLKIGPRFTRDIRRDILLRELNNYEDKAEYTYERIA